MLQKSNLEHVGVTYGEPNGIFYLQRPLWAAFSSGNL